MATWKDFAKKANWFTDTFVVSPLTSLYAKQNEAYKAQLAKQNAQAPAAPKPPAPKPSATPPPGRQTPGNRITPPNQDTSQEQSREVLFGLSR